MIGLISWTSTLELHECDDGVADHSDGWFGTEKAATDALYASNHMRSAATFSQTFELERESLDGLHRVPPPWIDTNTTQNNDLQRYRGILPILESGCLWTSRIGEAELRQSADARSGAEKLVRGLAFVRATLELAGVALEAPPERYLQAARLGRRPEVDKDLLRTPREQ